MNLSSIQITFDTHNDDKNPSTVLHVFVKNRRPDTSTPMGGTDFITNHLAYQFNERPEFAGINPFLGCLENISPETNFGDPSTHTFNIPLRSKPISNEEIFLPVVNIHIQADDGDRWIFSYTITFTFDDGHSQFSFSSNFNGVTGIIVDQDNRNYDGICAENPFNRMPAVHKPQSDLVLTKVKMIFSTHNDDKNSGTSLNVHIFNRLNATSSQDILVATNILPGQGLSDPSTQEVVFPPEGGLSPILMQDIVLPQIFINIGAGQDRWIFDYQIYFYFTSPSNNGKWWTAVSESNGIILDQDNHKYAGVYNGAPFPTVDPLSQPTLKPVPADHPVPTSYTDQKPKKIYISYLQKKLDDLINNRQGVGSQDPPLYKIRLDNAGRFNEDTLPESYFDLQSITANPPAPGTLSPHGYTEPVIYLPSPSSLGQVYHASFGDVYFSNLNSQTLKVAVDPASPTPLSVELAFDCSGTNQIVGGSWDSTEGRTLTSFTITLHLTLTWDQTRNCVDLMSWVPEILGLKAVSLGPFSPLFNITGQFLGKPVNVTASNLALYQATLRGQVIDVRLTGGGLVEDGIRDSIFDNLSKPVSAFDSQTGRDHLNSTVNSWLLGGALASDQDVNGANYVNGAAVTGAVSIENDAQGPYIALRFNGPHDLFVPEPYSSPAPTPGALANIDHIVVLTMENRSFDHMLGYLSLPLEQQGMGRTDVDGLKGGEINYANGVACPSKPFVPTDTIMNPDPPHSWEPVTRAINNGNMDGFAQAYYDESGIDVAARIMKYHTAANVPVYDALVRDFAICDRWFASFPGPTFCNRFHELTGFLNIDADGFWESHNSSPKRAVFTANIFDYLTQHGVSWKYFEHHYCFLRFFQNYTFDTTNVVDYDDPGLGFENVARTGNLPSVTFIDPHFIELPPGGNCDGAPADIAQGQLFVRQVVDSVISSPNWDKTMLIIVYDEHGGFYDHVPPPQAAVIAEDTGLPTTYGVRVPAFIVSPWVTGGMVFGSGAGSGGPALHFDHTSILKTIASRFLGANMPPMGARFEAANDLSSILTATPRSGKFRPFLPYKIQYARSGMCLEVEGGNPAPATPLWVNSANPIDAQGFSLEDAGGGLYYIRTHCGNQYVGVSLQGDGSTNTPGAIIQGPKAPVGASNAKLQLWSIQPPQFYPSNYCTIHNANFPNLTLQPQANSLSGQVPVVLGTPTPFSLTPNEWSIAESPSSAPLQPDPTFLVSVPAKLAFAKEYVGSFVTQGLTISNIGTGIITIQILPAPHTKTSYFSWMGVNVSVNPGQSIVVDVNFSPTRVAPFGGTMVINSNAVGSPFHVSLTGTGVPGNSK